VNSSLLALIIEPDHGIQQSLIETLQPHFQCLVMSTWQEADRLVDPYYPDIILAELHQMDNNWSPFLQRLRANPKTHKCLIVGLTDQGAPLKSDNEIEAKPDHVAFKPLSNEVVEEILR
jgi:DNA-binding response OmpR family regulator